MKLLYIRNNSTVFEELEVSIVDLTVEKTRITYSQGITSYILVYTDVPLDWVGFLSCQIYDWGGKFALGYVNGW